MSFAFVFYYKLYFLNVKLRDQNQRIIVPVVQKFHS